MLSSSFVKFYWEIRAHGRRWRPSARRLFSNNTRVDNDAWPVNRQRKNADGAVTLFLPFYVKLAWVVYAVCGTTVCIRVKNTLLSRILPRRGLNKHEFPRRLSRGKGVLLRGFPQKKRQQRRPYSPVVRYPLRFVSAVPENREKRSTCPPSDEFHRLVTVSRSVRLIRTQTRPEFQFFHSTFVRRSLYEYRLISFAISPFFRPGLLRAWVRPCVCVCVYLYIFIYFVSPAI